MQIALEHLDRAVPGDGHALAQRVDAARDQVRDEGVAKVVRPDLADAGLAEHAHRGLRVSIDALPGERLALAAALHRAEQGIGGLRAHARHAMVDPLDEVVRGLGVEPERDLARVATLRARRRQREHLALAADHHVAHLQVRRFVAPEPAAREKAEDGELALDAAGAADADALAQVGDDGPDFLEVEDAKSHAIGAYAGSFLVHAGLSRSRVAESSMGRVQPVHAGRSVMMAWPKSAIAAATFAWPTAP